MKFNQLGRLFNFLGPSGAADLEKKKNPDGIVGVLFLREEACVATMLFLLDFLLFLFLLLLLILFPAGFKTCKSNSTCEGNQYSCCNNFLHNLRF